MYESTKDVCLTLGDCIRCRLQQHFTGDNCVEFVSLLCGVYGKTSTDTNGKEYFLGLANHHYRRRRQSQFQLLDSDKSSSYHTFRM
mmetsp:Transcript_3058/g.4516  ORF Transcript_3058/g.4516 Transcript_3058/m.4516 type:complete len:86 (+) Transcript_3058:759-1016(+)